MYIGTQGQLSGRRRSGSPCPIGRQQHRHDADEPLNEWTTDLLSRYRERCAKFGINLK